MARSSAPSQCNASAKSQSTWNASGSVRRIADAMANARQYTMYRVDSHGRPNRIDKPCTARPAGSGLFVALGIEDRLVDPDRALCLGFVPQLIDVDAERLAPLRVE